MEADEDDDIDNHCIHCTKASDNAKNEDLRQ